MPYIYLENGKKVKISEESYKALAKAVKENEILVPDDIKIENRCSGDGLGIVFNEGKQLLIYDRYDGLWKVWSADSDYWVRCKLVPVDKENLKVGYTYFRTISKYINYKELLDVWRYCKYLGNNKYVYATHDGAVEVKDVDWDYWYQVVPIEDE